jgi:hypothetical protein
VLAERTSAARDENRRTVKIVGGHAVSRERAVWLG